MKNVYVSILVGFLALQTACLEVDEPVSNAQPAAEIMEVGQACELTAGCSAGLTCDPVIDEGETIGAVCLIAQGHECNTDYDLCGRGLKCTSSPDNADVNICLPGGCIDDSECASGQVCNNFQCFQQTGCNNPIDG